MFLSPMDPSALVLFSEATLSLYPILIRTLPTTLFTQWFARFLTFPVLAYLLASSRDIPSLSSLFALLLRPSTFFAGLLNLVHIGASYVSFSLLPAGVALSLFYTYPLFNVLAGSIVFGEALSVFTFTLLAIALFGVWLLSREQAPPAPLATPAPPPTLLPTPLLSSLSPSTMGIIAALVAALTETLLYVFVRWTAVKEASTPFTAILQLYPIGLLVLLAFIGINPSILDLRPHILLPLFGFNALIGFIGYATRFYTIPKVSTLVFSLLSFVGVLFGYLWGHWFTSDRITPMSLLGSGLIVVSAFLARYQNQK